VTNSRVLLFTALVAVGATLLFGAMAAWRLGRPLAIRQTRGASASHQRVRAALVTAEVAIATMLITIAIALSQSFARLQAVDPGFTAERLLTARLTLPRARFARTEQIQQFTDSLLPKLLAIPGVEDAAAVNVVPLNGYHATADVWPADRPVPPPAERIQAEYRMIVFHEFVQRFRPVVVAHLYKARTGSDPRFNRVWHPLAPSAGSSSCAAKSRGARA